MGEKVDDVVNKMVYEIDKFIEIEQKYELAHKQIYDTYYWVYQRGYIVQYAMRDTLMSQTQREKNDISRSGNSNGKKMEAHWGKCRAAIRLLTKATKKYMNSGRRMKKTEICFVGVLRKIKVDSLYIDPYISEIQKCFPESMILNDFEKILDYHPREEYINEHDISYINEWVTFSIKLNQQVKTRLYARTLSEVRNQMSEALGEMQREYELQFDEAKIYERIANLCIGNRVALKLYQRLFRKMKPKVIVLGMDTRFTRNIIEVANRLGIPTVMLQNYAYNRVQIMPMADDATWAPFLPTKYFLFSDYWKRFIRLPIPDENIVGVGYPYHDSMMKKYQKRKSDKQKKTIILLSQPVIGKTLSELAIELRQALCDDKYHIIYRYHPNETEWYKGEQGYPELESYDIEVSTFQDTNLFDLFSRCDIQVGVHSNGILEGLGFNLKTYIYRIHDYKRMQDLVDVKCAEFIKDCQELAEKIETEENIQEKMDFASVIYRPDGLKNMKSELDKMLATSTSR